MGLGGHVKRPHGERLDPGLAHSLNLEREEKKDAQVVTRSMLDVRGPIRQHEIHDPPPG
jgi:hypothetical protein